MKCPHCGSERVIKAGKTKRNYEHPGFIDGIPHVKFIRGVIIVRETDDE